MSECRILQYGNMSMSSEGPEEIKRTFKADGTAGGDQGLLNLLTDDTVFYVGGYPSSFKVSAQTTVCFCCGDGLSHGESRSIHAHPVRIRWC